MSERKRLSPLFTWRSALCDSGLPSTARHVGLTLSLHMSERGDSCYPTVRQLADETGYHTDTITKATRALRDAGWLTVSPGRGRGRASEYTAKIPAQFTQGASDETAASDDAPAHATHDTPDEKTPDEDGHKPLVSDLSREKGGRARAQDDNRASDPPGGASGSDTETAPSIQPLIAAYVDEARRNGTDPTTAIKNRLAGHLKRLVEREHRDPNHLVTVVETLAREGKPVGHIDYVLQDYERYRAGVDR